MQRTAASTVLAISLVLSTACGSAEPATSSGPTVVPAELGGAYQLDRLEAEGAEVPLDDIVELRLDAEFGELQVDTGCGLFLGSFSLLDDGRAGFTVAGGSSRECSPNAAAQSDALLASLARVDAWTPIDRIPGIALTGPAGDQITLRR